MVLSSSSSYTASTKEELSQSESSSSSDLLQVKIVNLKHKLKIFLYRFIKISNWEMSDNIKDNTTGNDNNNTNNENDT